MKSVNDGTDYVWWILPLSGFTLEVKSRIGVGFAGFCH